MAPWKIANPRPSALIESLRSIGYDLPTAVADIIDNSITAHAKNVPITFHWAGNESWIRIADDGDGMSANELFEAMRPGSQNPLDKRSSDDLGRFGLGLKTASFSQARRLTVFSRKSGSSTSCEWDLDYVESTNEWRLLTKASDDSKRCLGKSLTAQTGTVIVWTKLDRLTSTEHVSDAAAHARFNDAIDHVRDYLALIFHRFLQTRILNITINDRPIEPWDPFAEWHPSTYKSPLEVIPYRQSSIRFQGYVLPHKDKLTAEEFHKLGGLNGWAAHQGFYVYRNKRLLVFGDWLRLGTPSPWTRDEQYKLARISIEITNETDADWDLDVKKSKARPPAIIRSRLTDLATKIRMQARTIFAHRGEYGPRSPLPAKLERPWHSVQRDGKRSYAINREHPLVKGMIASCVREAPQLDTLLRLIEETVPVEQIWLDTAEQATDRAAPYETLDFNVLRSDLRKTFDLLRRSGVDAATARQRLLSIEPFNRYPALVKELA